MCLPDVVDLLESIFPPELTILRDPGPHSRPGTASRHSGLPFPFPPSLSLPSSLDDRPWESTEPEEHQGTLSVGLTVQCEDSRMVVSIDKESLNVSGEQDQTCEMESNIGFIGNDFLPEMLFYFFF